MGVLNDITGNVTWEIIHDYNFKKAFYKTFLLQLCVFIFMQFSFVLLSSSKLQYSANHLPIEMDSS